MNGISHILTLLTLLLSLIYTSLIIPPIVVIPDNVSAFYEVEPTSRIKAPYKLTETPIYQQKLDTRAKVKEYTRWSAGMLGTDVNLALDLLKWESTYCEKPWNNWPNKPISTAKGCFMFINTTWDQYCSGDVMDRKDNMDCGIRMIGNKKLLRQHWGADPIIRNLLTKNGYL